jgi:hypothetical protein
MRLSLSSKVQKKFVEFLALVETDDAIPVDAQKAFSDGLSWIENCRVRVTGKPPLERGQFAFRNLTITDHAFTETKKLRDQALRDTRAIESSGRLTMIVERRSRTGRARRVETIHREIKEHAIVALAALPSIPPTPNARLAGGSISGSFELLAI